MWTKIAKIAPEFLLKYIIGLVFAVICFVVTIPVCAVLVMGTSSCIGALGNVFALGILAGIPTGAVLGIFLVDKFILGVAVLKRQIIAGFVVGIATSASLVILHFCGVKILPYGHDGPSGLLGRVSIFYIIGVLAALLGYTIAGLTKRKTTNEANPRLKKLL